MTSGTNDEHPTWHERVTALFEKVFEWPPAERAAYYRSARTDPDLATEVEQLLGSDHNEIFDDESTSQPMPALLTRRSETRLGPGITCGDYRIVREIARGGMGAVFEAVQISLGRRVALKVILGARFASEQDVQRFRLEAEAIARLDHPGIVPVYEVGEFAGESYFSMAFVGGGSLADLEVPAAPKIAAELVKPIAEAIHFAHSRNIVHRDLKPANILLGDSRTPKVSDFGIAKDLGEGSEELTHAGSILGTPGFLAPEQARGDVTEVGPAADVYGLGGVLFHLLTGRAPIRGDNLVDTLHRVIHEDVPSVRRLRASVPQDLASICARCLEKDPARRYSSALALAEDLERFLGGLPILARPVGVLARLGKWGRRRPATAAATAAAVSALAVGAIVSTRFGILASERADTVARQNVSLRETNEQLEEARQAAVTSRNEMEAFSRFLVDDVISAARNKGVQGGLGTDITLRQALLYAVERVPERFAGQPVAEALARHDLGVTLRTVGEQELAAIQLRRALELRSAQLGEQHEQTFQTMNSLAMCLSDLDRKDEALGLMERMSALNEAQQIWPDEMLRFARADLLIHFHDPRPAVRLLESILGAEDDPGWVVEIQMKLGECYFQLGEFDEALQQASAAAKLIDHPSGATRETALQAKRLAAECLIQLDRGAEAIPLMEEVLPLAIDTYTADHDYIARFRIILARTYHDAGRLEDHVEQLVELVRLERALRGETESYFSWLEDIRIFSQQLGDHDRAVTFGMRSLEHLKRTAPDSARRHRAQSSLCGSTLQTGQFELCAQLGHDGLRDLLDDAGNAPFRQRAELEYRAPLGMALLASARYAEALPHQKAVMKIFEEADGDAVQATNLRLLLAISELESGDATAARHRVASELAAARLPKDSLLYGMLSTVCGRALLELGQRDQGAERLRRARSVLAPHLANMTPTLVRAHAAGMLRLAELEGDVQATRRWREKLEQSR